MSEIKISKDKVKSIREEFNISLQEAKHLAIVNELERRLDYYEVEYNDLIEILKVLVKNTYFQKL